MVVVVVLFLLKCLKYIDVILCVVLLNLKVGVIVLFVFIMVCRKNFFWLLGGRWKLLGKLGIKFVYLKFLVIVFFGFLVNLLFLSVVVNLIIICF